MTIIGTVLFTILLSCGSDRRPSGPRPAASGQAGLGRAANARRAAERGPRPFGEEPPTFKPKHTLSAARRSARQSWTPDRLSVSRCARRHQGHAPWVGLRPSLDRACAQRSFDAARSGRRNGLQIEQRNWTELALKAPLTRSCPVHPQSCTDTSQNCTKAPAFTRFTLLHSLRVRAKFLSVLNAQDLTAIGTYCDDALSDHPAA